MNTHGPQTSHGSDSSASWAACAAYILDVLVSVFGWYASCTDWPWLAEFLQTWTIIFNTWVVIGLSFLYLKSFQVKLRSRIQATYAQDDLDLIFCIIFIICTIIYNNIHFYMFLANFIKFNYIMYDFPFSFCYSLEMLYHLFFKLRHRCMKNKVTKNHYMWV